MKLLLFPLRGGNVQSLVRAFQKLGVTAHIAQDISDLNDATHVVLPGIGSFEKAMEQLDHLGWKQQLLHKIQDGRTFTLGICLGMQLLGESSEETSQSNSCAGLSLIPGKVVRFTIENTTHFKIPHNGWNNVEPLLNDPLLEGLHSSDQFYFLHAYHYAEVNPSHVLGTTQYEHTFPSVVKNQRCYGVQFHPEKSHEAGLTLLRNFINLK